MSSSEGDYDSENDSMDEEIQRDFEEFLELWETNIELRFRDLLRQLYDDGLLFNISNIEKCEEYKVAIQKLQDALFIVSM